MTPDEANRREWDVLVVGAGPAGSVAARELARRGLRVLLVDKATFPRGKVCGCCLNGAALDALCRVGLGHLPADLGAVPLNRVRLAAGGRSATLPLPAGMAVSRHALDSALIREAVEAGAHFLPGTAVKRTDDWRARVVVAADGLNGRLSAGGDNPQRVAESSRIGAGAVIPDPPPGYEPGTIFMAVGRGGYVGLVRLEDGQLDVAAAFDPTFVRIAGGPGPAAARVLKQAGLPEVRGLTEAGWRGTPPLTRTPRRRSGPGWFAVGDAAGYVEPFTGEGMAWAIGSAAAVAPVAARAAEAGWHPALSDEWEATFARVVRNRQVVCRVAARGLRSPAFTRLAVGALALLPGLAAPVVSRLNRPSLGPTPDPEFLA